METLKWNSARATVFVFWKDTPTITRVLLTSTGPNLRVFEDLNLISQELTMKSATTTCVQHFFHTLASEVPELCSALM